MKRKELWIGVGVIALLFIIAFYLDAKSKTKAEPVVTEETEQVDSRVVEDSVGSLDIRNATYQIGEDSLLLVDGTLKGSSRVTKLLEGPAFTDLNKDGAKDAVVILRDETGGSGVFYYVAIALATGDSQKTTNSILLGDRVRIKEIAVNQGIIFVTILERGAADAMTTPPGVGKILRFTLDGDKLKAL